MREAEAYLMGWVLPQDSTRILYSPIQFNKETKSPANDAQLAKRVPSPLEPHNNSSPGQIQHMM